MKMPKLLIGNYLLNLDNEIGVRDTGEYLEFKAAKMRKGSLR
jgi:hypothetical protein